VPAPVPFSFHEFDLTDARDAIARDYFPTTLALCSAPSPYEFRFDGHAHDAVTPGHAWYTSAMRIGIEEVGAVYVNLPSRGTMLAEHRSRAVDVGPSRAAVFRPTGTVVMTTSDDYDSLAVNAAAGGRCGGGRPRRDHRQPGRAAMGVRPHRPLRRDVSGPLPGPLGHAAGTVTAMNPPDRPRRSSRTLREPDRPEESPPARVER
jgi:hypothetical protein